MQGLLQWPPILWTLRLVLLIVLTGGAGVFMLLVARFFRWKHVKALVTAELPRVQSVGGEFGGTKATIELAHQNDAQLELLTRRVENLHETLQQLLDELRKEERNTDAPGW